MTCSNNLFDDIVQWTMFWQQVWVKYLPFLLPDACRSLRCAGAGVERIPGVWVCRIAGPAWWCSAVERSGPVPCFPPALTLFWIIVSSAKPGGKPFPSFVGWAFLARGAEMAPSAVDEHRSWCRGELRRGFSQTAESFWLAAAARKLVLPCREGTAWVVSAHSPVSSIGLWLDTFEVVL